MADNTFAMSFLVVDIFKIILILNILKLTISAAPPEILFKSGSIEGPYFREGCSQNSGSENFRQREISVNSCLCPVSTKFEQLLFTFTKLYTYKMPGKLFCE